MKRRGFRRQPARRSAWLLWLVVLLVLGGAYWLEVQQREQQAYAGLPRAQDWRNWQTWHRVLRNPGFMVGYSEIRMNPLWVTYRLVPVPPGPSDPRPARFSADWRSLARVDHDDYSGSGYDRGHLAPNYAMSRVHGREAQLRSFWMTNISPQQPNLNRTVWQRIEEAAMDHFAPLKGEVWVITGPVFDADIERLPSAWVEIPDAFYKLFVAPPAGDRPLRVLAFMVPQQVSGREPLDRFLVSVREVEVATGLDFLHRLPQPLQDEVETVIQPEAWQLDRVNHRRGRF